MPVQKQSQDVCKCMYHENIDLICTSLVNLSRSKKLKLNYKNISTADNIWKLTVCDIYKKDCVWRRCEKCSCENIDDEFQLLQPHTEAEITVSQWETVMVHKEKEKKKVDSNSASIVHRVTRKEPRKIKVKDAIEMLKSHRNCSTASM